MLLKLAHPTSGSGKIQEDEEVRSRRTISVNFLMGCLSLQINHFKNELYSHNLG